MRVVVRHRIRGGLTDAVGRIEAMDEHTVSLSTRRGPVVVQRHAVVAAKEVPPAPSRRGAPHLAVSMTDLQRLMVDGWPPIEREHLGSWLLRAGGGYTGRANSVLPLGDPGLPLEVAVSTAERWYDARGLRRLFALYGPEGFAIGEDPLGSELAARGYDQFNRSLIMTGSVDHVAGVGEPVGVTLDGAPSEGWWRTYAARRPGDRGAMEAILTGSPEQLFASVRDGQDTVAAGRVAFAHAWAGVSAVNVLESHRRRGLATALMAACAAASRARGIRSMYVQVEATNKAAISLYERLGLARHHEYVYLGA